MKVLNFNAKLLKVEKLTPNIKSFKFKIPKNFTFKPGQFITIHFILNNQKIVRQYSIANTPKNNLELCIKIINGPGSEYVDSLKKGDIVKMSGPYGVFFVKNEKKDIVCFSSGTGVAPFLGIVSDLLGRGKKNIVLIAGYKYEKDILYDEKFRELERGSDGRFSYNVVLSSPKDNYEFKGHVHHFFDNFVSKDFVGDFYVCGLKPMVIETKGMLLEKGIDRSRINFERYS